MRAESVTVLMSCVDFVNAQLVLALVGVIMKNKLLAVADRP